MYLDPIKETSVAYETESKKINSKLFPITMRGGLYIMCSFCRFDPMISALGLLMTAHNNVKEDCFLLDVKLVNPRLVFDER